MKVKWADSRKEERVLIKNVSIEYSKKIVSVPTHQYYNVSYTEETVHDIATKIRQRKKSMTTNDKDEVEGSFNSKNLDIILCIPLSEYGKTTM